MDTLEPTILQVPSLTETPSEQAAARTRRKAGFLALAVIAVISAAMVATALSSKAAQPPGQNIVAGKVAVEPVPQLAKAAVKDGDEVTATVGRQSVIEADEGWAWQIPPKWQPAFDRYIRDNVICFTPLAAGEYNFVAVSAKGATLWVSVKVDPSTVQTEAPVVEIDKFAGELKIAYAKTAEAEKVKLGLLAAVYRAASKMSADGNYASYGALITEMKSRSESTVGDSLKQLRSVIDAEVTRSLAAGGEFRLSDRINKQLAVDTFDRVVTALSSLTSSR